MICTCEVLRIVAWDYACGMYCPRLRSADPDTELMKLIAIDDEGNDMFSKEVCHCCGVGGV